MSNLDQCLALTSERRKDRAVLLSNQSIIERHCYNVPSKVFDGMRLEV